jgi:hypothetical protein
MSRTPSATRTGERVRVDSRTKETHFISLCWPKSLRLGGRLGFHSLESNLGFQPTDITKPPSFRRESSLRRLSLSSIPQFLEKFVYHLIQLLAVNVPITNDASGIKDVHGWPTLDVPLAGDGTARIAPVPPGTPGDLLLLKDFLEFPLIGIAIDAEEGERFVFQPFDERPLVRVHGPARSSPVPPEIEHHYLALIIAQLEWLAVDVLSLDLRSRLAYDEMMYLEQRRFGPFAKCPARRSLHIAVMLYQSLLGA